MATFSSYGPRSFSNNAPPQALTTGVAGSSGAVTLQVASTAGYPSNPFISGLPFLLAIERGTLNQEVCLCIASTGTTFTVLRGFDGTTPKVHSVGAIVEHTAAELDYREANKFITLIQSPGDLLVGGPIGSTNPPYGSGAPSVETLPVGPDGTFLAADSTATTGLSYQQPVPVGSIFYTILAAAPTGYVLALGQVLTGITTTSPYWNLYNAMGGTSGNLTLPDGRGRFLVGAGSGPGLTARALKDKYGAENGVPHHGHTVTGNGPITITIHDTGHTHNGPSRGPSVKQYVVNTPTSTLGYTEQTTTPQFTRMSFATVTGIGHTGISATASVTIGVNDSGSSTPKATLPPYYAVNTIIKL